MTQNPPIRKGFEIVDLSAPIPGREVYINNDRFFYMSNEVIKEFLFSDMENIANWSPQDKK